MVRPSLRTPPSLVALVAALLVLGCVREEPLEERAAKYWNARKDRDAATAYRYEHPDSRGNENEYSAKILTGPLVISAAEIGDVEIDGGEAKVTVRMTYRHPMMPRDVKAPIVDLWTKVDGRWYHKTLPTEFVAGSGIDDALRRRSPVATPGARP